jgi:heptaprenyl diphosphate synthase
VAGTLAGLGAVLHVVEGLIPVPVVVPGAKLGLANAATLVALDLVGPAAALAVAVVRPFLGALAGGGLLSVGFVLSLAGAVVSGLVMVGLRAAVPSAGPGSGGLSLTGVSLAGGVAHNLGQLGAASAYVGPAAAVAYLGPLILAGLASGYVVGRLAGVLTGSAAVRRAVAAAWGW